MQIEDMPDLIGMFDGESPAHAPICVGGWLLDTTHARWDGFLDKTDAWQKMASRRLANYFAL